MKRFLAICLVLFIFGFFQNLLADGTSGCGLGSQIWKGKTGAGFHLVAVTTNGMFFGSSSQTSGTSSGCDNTKAVEREEIQRVYLAQNYDNLIEDASQGQGPYLATYAGLFGCS
ncbi:MAG: DUF3015 family protein, partial [Deltaproteobacteria bacterium]|nr:DUF3015 family protein [Deltaproteobacteria bacterium]